MNTEYPERVKMKWQGGDTLSYEDLGVKITLGECCENPAPGEGFPPLRLVLGALGGCTGMDVLQMLEKMRIKLEDFHIEVKGRRVTSPPRVFKQVEIVYKFKGKNLDEESLKRAIDLSLNKYCPVAAMVSRTGKIKYRIVINEV